MLEVFHNEPSNLDFNVVAIQETRIQCGIKKFDNFALLSSGSEGKKHAFGCGFLCK
jgi:hypothetical protein